MSFAFDDTKAYYFPFTHFEGAQLTNGLARVAKYLSDATKEKIAHNAKFDEKVLQTHGVEVKGVCHDTLVMAWMLTDNTSPGDLGLKKLTHKFFDVEMETYEDVISAAPKQKNIDRDYNFARVGLDEALSYAADDAYYAFGLYEMFKPQLKQQALWDAYMNVDRPFVRVLKEIELSGVTIDTEYIKRADERLPKLLEEVEASIYEQAGQVFNINSGKQLGKILFDREGLGIGNLDDLERTKNGDFVTDAPTLKKYSHQHQIIKDILRQKKISKTHDVFVKSLSGFIGSDKKVHPQFNGCGTRTGRLSCSKPNLQQVEGDEVEEIRPRNFFIPSPGSRFVVADYGQIELRVMAHLAKDEAAIKAFLSGRDFHDETARSMFQLGPEDEVAHRQRFTAKSLNFGIPYGRGPWSVGIQLGVAPQCQYWPHYDKKLLEHGAKHWYNKGEMRDKPCNDCAKCFIEKWWEGFPQVKELKKKTLAKAKREGFVRTITGRKRRLPNINSGNAMLRSSDERRAFNTVIQGSAAEIIKLAMIALQPALRPFDAKICLQVHDELVVDAPAENAEEVLETVQDIMENPVNGTNPLRLPLVADPKIVDRWGDAKG